MDYWDGLCAGVVDWLLWRARSAKGQAPSKTTTP